MSSFTDALVLKVHTGTLAERPFELLAKNRTRPGFLPGAERPGGLIGLAPKGSFGQASNCRPQLSQDVAFQDPRTRDL